MSRDYSKSFVPGMYENALGQKRRLIHADLDLGKVWWEHIPLRRSPIDFSSSISVRVLRACPELAERKEYVWQMESAGWLRWLAKGRGKKR